MKIKTRDKLKRILFLGFSLSPAAIILIIFSYVAMGYCLWISFHRWNMLEPMRWIGLDNYITALHSWQFWNSVKITFIYAAVAVPACVILGLLVALILNQIIYARSFYRLMFFLPVITSMVVAAIVWKWLFDPDVGLINYVLYSIGIPHSHWLEWLRDPKGGALLAVLVVGIWKRIGYNAVIFLAGLQNIPKRYFEAATIDGAGAISRFWYITVPLLSPTTFFVVVLQVISAFRVVVSVFVMTRGGPAKSTDVLVYYLWENAFHYFRMGYA
ncbi:MAG TPA: sugar ABC transporter permease, partial [Candidatus Aerophobetes bacterium]|nr:sugar ABC transporter permease [Candidatus Aerophobetes bacterium]